MTTALLEDRMMDTEPATDNRWTISHLLNDLGNIPAYRVRLNPHPGTATEEDALRISETERCCKLINATIVEKAMAAREDIFSTILAIHLWKFVQPRKLGVVVGPRAMFRMSGGNLREPDVSFTSRERVPKPFPSIGGWCPDICAEVLSPDNTKAEMKRKRTEFFESGCRIVWEFEPRTEVNEIFLPDGQSQKLSMTDSLDGIDILPGFSLSIADLYAEFYEALDTDDSMK